MRQQQQQGSFLQHNSYAMRGHVPWYVAFVTGGNLGGRAEPFFDSSLEISLELLSEWRAFHSARQNPPPVVAVHFPLDGEHLLRAMTRLGFGARTLSKGTELFLSALAKAVLFRECYVPMPFLKAIEEEAATLPPFPVQGRQRVAEGAWLSDKPQSPWSRWHTAVDGQEGYLWYAPVYAAGGRDWERSVDIKGFPPAPAGSPAPPRLEDWLGGLRSRGIRVVPVLAATEADDEQARALAQRAQEEKAPRGLVYQNSPNGDAAPVPVDWWELSPPSQATTAAAELRLEASFW